MITGFLSRKELIVSILASFLSLSLLSSCSTDSPPSKKVNHVVLCWLKDNSPEVRNKFMESVKGLKSIPEVCSVSTGVKLTSIEPVADNSFDIGFIITFKTPEDLKKYLIHEDHVRAVKEVLKPSLAKVIVYDFEGQ